MPSKLAIRIATAMFHGGGPNGSIDNMGDVIDGVLRLNPKRDIIAACAKQIVDDIQPQWTDEGESGLMNAESFEEVIAFHFGCEDCGENPCRPPCVEQPDISLALATEIIILLCTHVWLYADKKARIDLLRHLIDRHLQDSRG